jgi:septal ring factor EnvC (AmiA/AmiB activator)
MSDSTTEHREISTSTFDLQKGNKNLMKTAIDRSNDEFESMKTKMREECTTRISAIKRQMIQLSNEQDRCEDYLAKLNQYN